MAMPVIVGAWSDYSGFSAQQAGLLAAIESSGGVAASLFIALTLGKLDRTRIAYFAIGIAIIANIVSTQVGEFYATSVVRALAGFGSGSIYALGLAALAGTTHTSRNFSVLLFVQVSFGMIEINLYAWLVERVGINGIYVSMALFLAAGATLIRWLPEAAGRQSEIVSVATRKNALGITPWVCLTAVFLFYVATGAFWAYIERIGRNGGLTADFVTGSLTYTQVLSLFGCVFAGWIGSKLGQFRPLMASLLFAAGASCSLILDVNNISFVLALCLFFFFWNAIDIYQLGTLGNIDASGRFVALVPAFQMTAVSLGPALAALLLGSYDNYQLVLAISAVAILLAAALYSFVYLVLRRRNIEQFDAA